MFKFKLNIFKLLFETGFKSRPIDLKTYILNVFSLDTITELNFFTGGKTSIFRFTNS